MLDRHKPFAADVPQAAVARSFKQIARLGPQADDVGGYPYFPLHHHRMRERMGSPDHELRQIQLAMQGQGFLFAHEQGLELQKHNPPRVSRRILYRSGAGLSTTFSPNRRHGPPHDIKSAGTQPFQKRAVVGHLAVKAHTGTGKVGELVIIRTGE